MNRYKNFMCLAVIFAGCGGSNEATITTEPSPQKPSLTFATEAMKAVADRIGWSEVGITDTPSDYKTFTIASSEYPSWAALGTAAASVASAPKVRAHGDIAHSLRRPHRRHRH